MMMDALTKQLGNKLSEFQKKMEEMAQNSNQYEEGRLAVQAKL